jgi:hypothetical protein
VSDWPDFGGESRGDWVSITCAERDAIVAAEANGLKGFSVAAAFTDVELGHFYTEWSLRGEELPTFRDDIWRKEFTFPDGTVTPPNARYSDGKCTHDRFVPAERAS